ncbi:MAG TPA: MlaD family protein [Candidatus Binataceae bacterium]|nr:MlaD family protein [Candidatus Binataceae bacterium]
MNGRANPRMVGAFVLGAVALAVVAVAVLGSGRLFAKSEQYVLFFKGNVNGLRIGAPVKIKGVQIGSVQSIRLMLNLNPQTAAQPAAATIRIPVIISIDRNRVGDGIPGVNLANPADVRSAIALGLRAQLATESFVTGLLYIDLDLHPGTPARFVLASKQYSDLQEIPTLPNAFEQAQSAATRLVSQLDKVKLDQMVVTATQTMAAIGQLASSPELKSALVSLNQTGQSVNRTAASIQRLTEQIQVAIGPMAASMQKSTQNIDSALLKAQTALDHIQMTLQPDSPLVYRADQALQDVSAAANSIRQLADYLQRNPSAVVRGRSYSGGASSGAGQ